MSRVSMVLDEMAEVVERHVRSQTFGQVRDLRVVTEDRVVVLHGHVDRYYVKQLAQHAAMEAALGWELANQIEVASLPSLDPALP